MSEFQVMTSEMPASKTTASDMTVKEIERLVTLENQLHEHLAAAEKAFEEIRDGRLYRESYSTFDEYQDTCWSYTYPLMMKHEEGSKSPPQWEYLMYCDICKRSEIDADGIEEGEEDLFWCKECREQEVREQRRQNTQGCLQMKADEALKQDADKLREENESLRSKVEVQSKFVEKVSALNAAQESRIDVLENELSRLRKHWLVRLAAKFVGVEVK